MSNKDKTKGVVAEADILRRFRNCVALEKANSTISLKPRVKLCFGANASLRAISQRKASLCIIPAKQSNSLFDHFCTAALISRCPVWSPEITPKEFATILGLPTYCTICVFPLVGDDEDPLDILSSIRTSILLLVQASV